MPATPHPTMPCVAYADDEYSRQLVALCADGPVQFVRVSDKSTLIQLAPSAIIFDRALASLWTVDALRAALPATPILARTSVALNAELPLPEPTARQTALRLLQTAAELHATRVAKAHYASVAENAEADLQRLAEASAALSAEADLSELLGKILQNAQDIACCDGASLFLVNPDSDPVELIFKLTRNDSVSAAFEESRLPADESSIAGYVALTGEEVVSDDVYAMAADVPYHFNCAFDRRANYHTRSLYCLPMRDYRGQVVGVLQFLNRKVSRDTVVSASNLDATVRPFDDHVRKTLSALASLSAVAIQTRMLIDNINQLFESFVQASVAAIEQRDPGTSGHSFRVADLSVALARHLPHSKRPDLARFTPDNSTLRELRYASLLHDFGKVGVREHILTKANKLYDWELQELRHRVALTRQRLRADVAEQLLALAERGVSDAQKVATLRQQFAQKSAQLDQFLASIVEHNQPHVMDQDKSINLSSLRNAVCDSLDVHDAPLLSERQYEALSLSKGSLTPTERQEIESHVTHTYNFLRMIPWTEELAGIPDIAGRHHEKLDGSGYPHGSGANTIPLQSRVMTICDIYDALTARDRPYKSAIDHTDAITILRVQAQDNKLDSDIVEIFIAADIADVVKNRDYPTLKPTRDPMFHHSVCDHTSHDH